MKADAIVAGAGIWGCTVARRLAEVGKRVLVLEKRSAVGGNCRCEIDPQTGIEVHTYGSHIFHTSNEDVWRFVRRFTEFNSYTHSVLACTKKIGVENRCTVDGLEEKKIGVENRCTADGSRSSIVAIETIASTSEGESGALGDRALPKSAIHSPTPTLHSNSYHTYHLPIGCTLLKEFFGREIKPSEMTDGERTQLFDAFIRGYTSKQWGVDPEKVDPSIIARLKVRDNYSTDYFDDPYQGIPADGYNMMFERMLEHPNITVQCGCELVLEKVGQESRSTADGLGSDTEVRYLVKVKGEGEEWINRFLTDADEKSASTGGGESGAAGVRALPVYYTGPIDALFNYKYGALPWRTLRFERETLPIADYQGNSVVNYTDVDVPFTRIHEFKHYHPEWGDGREKIGVENRCTADGLNPSPVASQKTVIMREYSATWQQGDEPYYPIDNADSRTFLARYQKEVEKFNRSSLVTHHSSLVVGGRLGGYKYFDMDKSIAAALKVDLV